MSSIWETLSKVDVSEHTEKKNGLTYLSWAWAWGKVKDHYPNASFHKHMFGNIEGEKCLPYTCDEHGFAYVMVTINIEDQHLTEVYPVLDYRNKAVQNPDSFQVNSALQRCLAKCCAMHGLGHYIYAGEDLPQGNGVDHDVKVTVESHDGKENVVEGLDLVAEVFETFIPECTDVDTLRGFWGKNKDALDILKKGDEKLYQKVLGNFTARSEMLKKKGEAA
jgi:hypothetical protein|tara:strand:- start:2294 stop:2956 length:663 start_codon:yes stop_codon:yes gene_type:complete